MKRNQFGTINAMVLSVVFAILLIAALIFGFWSFSGRQKYKNDANSLINTAVAQAKIQQQTTDNKNFAVEERSPFLHYVGPQAYGTISLYYPKTWNAFIDTSGSNSSPLDSYFYDGPLPSVTDNGTYNFALRVQVESQTYSQIVQNFQQSQQNGGTTITAYSLPKLPSVVGIKVVGQIGNNLSGTLVVLPLRTQAIEVWTEGSAYLSEFNNDILPNLSFSP